MPGPEIKVDSPPWRSVPAAKRKGTRTGAGRGLKDSLHFGTVAVVAMGLGLFAPPVGLGLFATCAITGTRVEQVARPMLKYLAVLAVVLVLLVLVPSFSLWLPSRFGM